MRACGNDAGTNCLPRFGAESYPAVGMSCLLGIVNSLFFHGCAFTLKTVFCIVIYMMFNVFISDSSFEHSVAVT